MVSSIGSTVPTESNIANPKSRRVRRRPKNADENCRYIKIIIGSLYILTTGRRPQLLHGSPETR